MSHPFIYGTVAATAAFLVVEIKFGISLGAELKEYTLKAIGFGQKAEKSVESRIARLAAKLPVIHRYV